MLTTWFWLRVLDYAVYKQKTKSRTVLSTRGATFTTGHEERENLKKEFVRC